MKTEILKFLLPLLGFSAASCVSLYAPLSVEFNSINVKGRVTDTEGQPVPGIKVSLVEKVRVEREFTVGYNRMDTVNREPIITDEYGYFEYNGREVDVPQNAHLSFEDVDGPANGGEFLLKEIKADFVKAADQEGAGNDEVFDLREGSLDATLERKPQE